MIKETKKAPTIRFRGFSDDWEQRKLGELMVKGGSGGTPAASKEEYYNGNIPFLAISDIKDRDIKSTAKKIAKAGLNNSAAWIVPHGAISLAMYASVGKVGILSIDSATSQAFFNMVFDEETLRNYVFYRLVKADFEHEWEPLISTGTQRNLNAQKVKNFEVFCPAEAEMGKVSKFLWNLDDLITLHQRKLDQLKQVKKYFLQNMFPAKGEKAPRIRFKGFTGDWEQRKLEDLASFSKGAGYSKSDLQASGTPIVLYGRLYTKYETVIKDIDTFVDALADSVYSQGGEVIVPASGETAEDISIASVVEKPGIVLGGDLNIIHPSDDLDSTFLAISISNGNPHKEMAKRAQGKSVVHLHNNDLAQIKLLYPSVTEQRKISQYFSGLDTLITLHQHKLDQLQTMKKFMLQNLFI
jgi:type I restriction enzyme S subunit